MPVGRKKHIFAVILNGADVFWVHRSWKPTGSVGNRVRTLSGRSSKEVNSWKLWKTRFRNFRHIFALNLIVSQSIQSIRLSDHRLAFPQIPFHKQKSSLTASTVWTFLTTLKIACARQLGLEGLGLVTRFQKEATSGMLSHRRVNKGEMTAQNKDKAGRAVNLLLENSFVVFCGFGVEDEEFEIFRTIFVFPPAPELRKTQKHVASPVLSF